MQQRTIKEEKTPPYVFSPWMASRRPHNIMDSVVLILLLLKVVFLTSARKSFQKREPRFLPAPKLITGITVISIKNSPSISKITISIESPSLALSLTCYSFAHSLDNGHFARTDVRARISPQTIASQYALLWKKLKIILC